jgi:FMNH2-dependent dimethyl sulfone monooxygenase
MTNPLFNDNKLKLGVFGLNGDTIRRTSPPEHYQFSWPNSLDVAEQADAAGLEAIVPFARWMSIAGPSHFGANVFDATAWAAAIAARTENCAVMTTAHITTLHPMIAARMMATIDHVCGGRFALNIVCGWFETEMKMFGQDLLPHDRRYAYADEWITAVKLLWESSDPVDFNGNFIKMERGLCSPRPLQRPHPPLMNAASSIDGRDFVAKHCDLAFILGRSFEQMSENAAGYRHHVREKSGREIQIWTTCAIIQGDTQAEAEALAQSYVDHADTVQVEQAFRPGMPYAGNLDEPPEMIEQRKRNFAMGSGSYLMIGDGPQIAREMQKVSDTGVDGLLMTFVEPQRGLRRLIRNVLPLLVAAGLRQE